MTIRFERAYKLTGPLSKRLDFKVADLSLAEFGRTDAFAGSQRQRSMLAMMVSIV